MRIIIVEDDENLREALKYICKDVLGHQAVAVSGGESALGLMDMIKPHLVFVDYNLEKMNGVDLTKKIKEISPHCTVIMVSGSRDMQIAIDAMRAGCSDFILKPYNINDIGAALNETQYRMDNVRTLEDLESEHITNVSACSATQREAARKLGINEATLWRKRKQLKAVA